MYEDRLYSKYGKLEKQQKSTKQKSINDRNNNKYVCYNKNCKWSDCFQKLSVTCKKKKMTKFTNSCKAREFYSLDFSSLKEPTWPWHYWTLLTKEGGPAPVGCPYVEWWMHLYPMSAEPSHSGHSPQVTACIQMLTAALAYRLSEVWVSWG